MTVRWLKIGDQCSAFGPMAPLMHDGLLVEIVRVNSRSRGIAGCSMPYLIRRVDGQRFDWAGDQPVADTCPNSGKEVWAARRHLRSAEDYRCAWEKWDVGERRAILDEDHSEMPACPYCSEEDECPHFLLLADTTFQTVEGGLLYEAFVERRDRLCEENDDDSDTAGDVFKALLSEVEALADAEREHDFEAGPGTASRNLHFFAASESRAEEILQSFLDAGGLITVPKNADPQDD